MNYEMLDLKIRSYSILAEMPLPLLIDIASIKYFSPKIIDYKIEIGSDYIVYDNTKNPFYGEIRYENMVDRLREIWNCIDFKIINDSSIIGKLNIDTFEDFEILCLHTDLVTSDEIYLIINEIIFYQEKMKKMFIDSCKEYFDLDRNFPNVKLKDDEYTRFVSSYSEFFHYPDIMIPLQIAAEFPMEVWFSENKGAALIDWSWREIECKKAYMTMKNMTEGFRETIKAKAMEISRDETSNKRR